MRMRWFLLAAVSVASACSSSTPDSEQPETDTTSQGGQTKSNIGIQSDIGALNESEALAAFRKASNKMQSCYEKGLSRIPYLSGDVTIAVRVPLEGKVRAYMKASTLGDRDTERCMLDAVANVSWPAPVGGNEGLAESPFNFAPSEGTRSPVEWSASDAGKDVDKAVQAIGSCSNRAGVKQLSATLYVETDGKVKSVGVSGEDVKSEDAAECVVKAMKDVKFNSPGSFAAKLTLTNS